MDNDETDKKGAVATVTIASGNVCFVNVTAGGLYWDGVGWSAYPPGDKITIVERPAAEKSDAT